MTDLRQQLREILRGRVCLVGVGNGELADDGLGVRLAEMLKSEVRNRGSEADPDSEIRRGGLGDPAADIGLAHTSSGQVPRSGFEVVVAGNTPECYVRQLADGAFHNILLLDAVDFCAVPGSVVLLDSGEMAARFAQISTHRLSLGLLARLIEAEGQTKVWLLGVQPESVNHGTRISRAVAATLDCLAALLRGEPGEVAA